MNKYINGFVEVVTIGDDKVSRVWVDDRWQYDGFCTRLSGALTSTPSPRDWKYPEGQVYTVTLYSSDETYPATFGGTPKRAASSGASRSPRASMMLLSAKPNPQCPARRAQHKKLEALYGLLT